MRENINEFLEYQASRFYDEINKFKFFFQKEFNNSENYKELKRIREEQKRILNKCSLELLNGLVFINECELNIGNESIYLVDPSDLKKQDSLIPRGYINLSDLSEINNMDIKLEAVFLERIEALKEKI